MPSLPVTAAPVKEPQYVGKCMTLTCTLCWELMRSVGWDGTLVMTIADMLLLKVTEHMLKPLLVVVL